MSVEEGRLADSGNCEKGRPNGSPCVYLIFRFNTGTSELEEMRKCVGGGWNRTGLSKRVLKSRTGRFIKTTAALSVTRMIKPSLPLKRITSPLRSRNGYCLGCQMRPKNSA